MTHAPFHESLADVAEGDLVRRLLADLHWRRRLLGLHGIPSDARDYPEVLHDDLGKKGDIDILVVNPTQPQVATGVQVKRGKIAARTFQTGNHREERPITCAKVMPNRINSDPRERRSAPLSRASYA